MPWYRVSLFIGFLNRSGMMLFSCALKDNKAFNRAFRSGRFCAAPFLTAYYLPNELGENRVGISVSKKIGNAVRRNRAKRVIRAAYRLRETAFPVGFDIVFAVRPAITDIKTQDIEAFFEGRLVKDMNASFDENGQFIGKKRKKYKTAGTEKTSGGNDNDDNSLDKKDG